MSTSRYLVHENQKWLIAAAGAGYYKISGVAGGQALSAANESVQLTAPAGVDDQLWKIDQLTDGSYRLKSNATGRALTATAKIKPGNGVALQTFAGDDTQRWDITVP